MRQSVVETNHQAQELERLRSSKSLLEEAQSTAHLGTWEWNVGQPEVNWTAELYRIYGVNPETYTPSFKGYLEKVHPDDQKRIREIMTRVLQEKIPFSHEERIIRPDGSTRYLHSWGHPSANSEGKLTRMIGVCLDITERKEHELKQAAYQKELERVLSLQSATIESTADGILVINNSGKIVAFNQKLLDIWHIDQSSLKARNYEDVLDSITNLLIDPDECKKHLRELVLNPNSESNDVIRFKDGTVLERYSRPQKIGGQAVGRVFSYRDVTDRVHAEVAAQNAIHLRDDFILTASHELRTPLTPLRMQLELLSSLIQSRRIEAKDRIGSELLDMIQNSDRQISSLVHLIQDMLEVTQMSGGRWKLNRSLFDLSHLVSDVVAKFQAQISTSHCSVEVHVAENIMVRYDRFRIEQVLSNLVSNAIKYGSGKPIQISASCEGERIKIIVQDFGIGISENDRTRIFGRFERAASSSRIGGLGLGLYITKQIVEAHGGQIFFESALGLGSKFTVELPFQAPETTT